MEYKNIGISIRIKIFTTVGTSIFWKSIYIDFVFSHILKELERESNNINWRGESWGFGGVKAENIIIYEFLGFLD